jgi:hypothetical protein
VNLETPSSLGQEKKTEGDERGSMRTPQKCRGKTRRFTSTAKRKKNQQKERVRTKNKRADPRSFLLVLLPGSTKLLCAE